MDLAGRTPLSPDVEVDVDFELAFSCSDTGVQIEVKDIKVESDFDNIIEIPLVFLGFGVATELYIDKQIKKSMPPLEDLNTSMSTSGLRCASTNVIEDGTVYLQFNL
ncbi:hypothetical protein LJR290_008001 [Variovorax sp. LjRoot290]|uniref:hypothetical protein n=1 Tax=Variovorax sp. LjRoot290 TaxID=3342316 RepID=UPI003ED0AE9B